jgi:hypothetical protein
MSFSASQAQAKLEREIAQAKLAEAERLRDQANQKSETAQAKRQAAQAKLHAQSDYESRALGLVHHQAGPGATRGARRNAH